MACTQPNTILRANPEPGPGAPPQVFDSSYLPDACSHEQRTMMPWFAGAVLVLTADVLYHVIKGIFAHTRSWSNPWYGNVDFTAEDAEEIEAFVNGPVTSRFGPLAAQTGTDTSLLNRL